MKFANNIKLCSLMALTVTVGLAVNVYAEGFGLDTVSKGLSSVQKQAESAQKTIDTTKQITTAGQQTATQAVSATGGLTETLVNKLGITSQQAQGGAGAVFKAARGQLNKEQFASLTKSVPEMDSLLNAAPEQSDSLVGMAGGLSSMLGDKNNTIGNLAGLASSFKDLNLSPDMVDQFVPVVVDYVKEKSGSMTAEMLQSALYGN